MNAIALRQYHQNSRDPMSAHPAPMQRKPARAEGRRAVPFPTFLGIPEDFLEELCLRDCLRGRTQERIVMLVAKQMTRNPIPTDDGAAPFGGDLTSDMIERYAHCCEREVQVSMKDLLDAGIIERMGGPGPVTGAYRLRFETWHATPPYKERDLGQRAAQAPKTPKAPPPKAPQLVVMPGTSHTINLREAVDRSEIHSAENMPAFRVSATVEQGILVQHFHLAESPPPASKPAAKPDPSEPERPEKGKLKRTAVRQNPNNSFVFNERVLQLKQFLQPLARRLWSITLDPDLFEKINKELGAFPLEEYLRLVDVRDPKPTDKPGLLVILARQAVAAARENHLIESQRETPEEARARKNREVMEWNEKEARRHKRAREDEEE